MVAPGIILINGPRGVGKTTAAQAIAGSRTDVFILSVMDPFKREVIAERGLDPSVYFDIFELLKDSPFTELQGATPRDVYLEAGRKARAADPNHLAKRWRAHAAVRVSIGQHVVMPDCRFAEEFYAAFEIVAPRDIMLVRLYDRRELHKAWEGDIGSWFDTAPLGQREVRWMNDQDLEYFRLEAAMFGRGFLLGRKS